METKEMICILCPLGCKMQVKEKPDRPGELSVRGQQCKLGVDYAYDEYEPDPHGYLNSGHSQCPPAKAACKDR